MNIMMKIIIGVIVAVIGYAITLYGVVSIHNYYIACFGAVLVVIPLIITLWLVTEYTDENRINREIPTLTQEEINYLNTFFGCSDLKTMNLETAKRIIDTSYLSKKLNRNYKMDVNIAEKIENFLNIGN